MIALSNLVHKTPYNFGRSGVPIGPEKSIPVPVHLTPAQHEWVEKRAEELHVSRGAIVRELVAWCIKESGVP